MATCGVQAFWKKGNHCKSLVCFALINFKAFCVLVGIQICQPGGWVRSDPSLSFTITRDFCISLLMFASLRLSVASRCKKGDRFVDRTEFF
jgi:hypothetical protein